MKKHIYIFLGTIILLGSCQKLDLVSEDQLSDGSLWKNSQDYERGVNILYNSFGTNNPTGLDLDSDIAYGYGPNSASNGNRIAPVTSGFYNGSYSNIRRCNFLIDRALANGFDDDRYVAEARFFRAYHYFNLVKAYGDVPFYTFAIDPGSEEDLYAHRTDRATVIDFLLSDLADLAQNLPLESELKANEKGRIARGTAMALRARIALFEATWAKYHNTGDDVNGRLDIAISSAKAVMDSGEYELFVYTPNPDESYRYFFMESGNDSKEQMLARRFDYDRRHSGFVSAPSTRKLVDMYVNIDGLPIDQSPLFAGRDQMASEFQDRDRRLWQTTIIPGAFTIDRLDQQGTDVDYPFNGNYAAPLTYYRQYKYITEFYIFSNGGSVAFNHVLRYAEVLLIYAEAIYERNNAITDSQLDESINKTRGRAGIVPLTNSFVAANGLDMLKEIRRERTVELAHEGFRRDDLRRWKTAEVELPMAMKGVQFGGTEFETAILTDNDGNPILDANGNTQLRYANPPNMDANGNVVVEAASERSFNPNRDYLEPLPTEELVNNPNLTQNPGW